MAQKNERYQFLHRLTINLLNELNILINFNYLLEQDNRITFLNIIITSDAV